MIRFEAKSEMPLKRDESNKRYISSDSEESYCETPKKLTIGAKRVHRLKEMVNSTNSYDIRLSNGKVNGISVDTNTYRMSPEMNPVVSLNRDAVESHMKRKSIGLVGAKGTPIGESDERRERWIRQTERAQQQRRSAVGLNGTPSRSSLAPTGITMNMNELTEHYTHCIQLSATNKINVKNAFGLHLIDYMSELIKQSQKDQSNGFVNFKLAGSALDAGAKIYCHRVDSVHAEAQKVASSLVMALNNDKNGNNNNNENQNQNDFNEMDDQNERIDDNGDGGQRPKRKKTTKRNVKTLVQNIETLNLSKIETNLEIDPVFHHLSAAFDMGNVNSLLMANLKVSPNGMLLLDSNSSLNFDNYCINETKMQNIIKFCNILNDVSKSSAKICPQLSSFEFLNRDGGIDLIPREEDPSFARRDSFAFDLNAEVEDIDEMSIEDMGAGDVFDNNDEDSDSDGPLDGPLNADQTVKKSLIRAVNMQGVGDLVKMLTDKPNDYTYFNPKMLSSWAGPMHWKRMPFWNKKDRIEGQNAETVGDKPRRQRRLFPELSFRNEMIFNEKECDILGGNEQKLKVATLQKWQSNQTELKLPADHGFDPKSLARSFIRPESTFHCVKSHEEVIDTTITSNTSFGGPTSPGMDRYDYDDDDDLPTGPFTDPLELGQSQPLSQLNPYNDMAFIGDNLVEQPYDLQQYNITFAKFAKKMDVKKLKRAMWDVISPISQPNTPISPQV